MHSHAAQNAAAGILQPQGALDGSQRAAQARERKADHAERKSPGKSQSA
jgi:hypothetical protein